MRQCFHRMRTLVSRREVFHDERDHQDDQTGQIHRDGYEQRNQKKNIKKSARQGDLLLRKRSSNVRLATAMPPEGLAECSELLRIFAGWRSHHRKRWGVFRSAAEMF